MPCKGSDAASDVVRRRHLTVELSCSRDYLCHVLYMAEQVPASGISTSCSQVHADLAQLDWHAGLDNAAAQAAATRKSHALVVVGPKFTQCGLSTT
jgi:hypothetical protein